MSIGPKKVNFKTGESRDFKVYARFKLDITKDELTRIASVDFVPKKQYEIELSNHLKNLLISQIASDGYVHSLMYNLEDKKGFSVDIPFSF